MDMANLQALLAQARSQQAAKPLVEFRAGRMTLTGTTVKADKRRGKIVMTKEDNLIHVKWLIRPGMTEDLNLTLFPGASKVEKVPECKSGRVIMLKLRQNNVKHFFWMQEPKDDKDDEFIKTMNEHLNPDGGNFAASAAAASTTPAPATPAPAATATATATPATPAVAAVATSASPAPTAAAAAGGDATSAALAASLQAMAERLQQQANSHNLVEILDADRVSAVLDEKDMKALGDFLPESQRSASDIKQQLRSPQFQQTVGRLSSLLNSEQYGTIMASLGLPVTGDLGVGAFIEAVKDQAKEEAKKGDAQ